MEIVAGHREGAVAQLRGPPQIHVQVGIIGVRLGDDLGPQDGAAVGIVLGHQPGRSVDGDVVAVAGDHQMGRAPAVGGALRRPPVAFAVDVQPDDGAEAVAGRRDGDQPPSGIDGAVVRQREPGVDAGAEGLDAGSIDQMERRVDVVGHADVTARGIAGDRHRTRGRLAPRGERQLALVAEADRGLRHAGRGHDQPQPQQGCYHGNTPPWPHGRSCRPGSGQLSRSRHGDGPTAP